MISAMNGIKPSHAYHKIAVSKDESSSVDLHNSIMAKTMGHAYCLKLLQPERCLLP